MKRLSTILAGTDFSGDKHLSREFQSFGLYLTEQLNDPSHKSLYMKMAKNFPRIILEEALSFARDSRAKNKAALFMWKLKRLQDSEGSKFAG